MKITKKYLEKIIKEEIEKILLENDNPRILMLREFFLDLFRAYTNAMKAEKKPTKLYVVGKDYDYKKILKDGMRDLGMNASDLYDELMDNFEDKIDHNMFVTLRGILEDQMLADDEDFRLGTEDRQDIEDGDYDRFKNYHGKPNIRLVKDDD
jgi:hypothetical protein